MSAPVSKQKPKQVVRVQWHFAGLSSLQQPSDSSLTPICLHCACKPGVRHTPSSRLLLVAWFNPTLFHASHNQGQSLPIARSPRTNLPGSDRSRPECTLGCRTVAGLAREPAKSCSWGASRTWQARTLCSRLQAGGYGGFMDMHAVDCCLERHFCDLSWRLSGCAQPEERCQPAAASRLWHMRHLGS